jgi:hypothetical protein
MNVLRETSRGAALGAGLTLIYSILFVVFALVRYGVDLWALQSDQGFWRLYAAGAFSLAAASLGIGCVLALVAGGIGAVTAASAVGMANLYCARTGRAEATASATLAAGAVVAGLHLVLWCSGILSVASLTSPAYWFWLGLPSLVFLFAAFLAGRLPAQGTRA